MTKQKTFRWIEKDGVYRLQKLIDGEWQDVRDIDAAWAEIEQEMKDQYKRHDTV